MILQRRKTRSSGTKQYYQWILCIPGAAVAGLGWEEGDDVAIEAAGDKLVVRKVTAAKPVSAYKVAKPMQVPAPAVIAVPVVSAPVAEPVARPVLWTIGEWDELVRLPRREITPEMLDDIWLQYEPVYWEGERRGYKLQPSHNYVPEHGFWRKLTD